MFLLRVAACSILCLKYKTLLFTHFFQRVHPIEADRFEMYKNSSKKRPPKSPSVSETTRQTKLFETSRGRTSDASVKDPIVKFIINGLHPLSTVEEPGFVALVTGVVSLHSKLLTSFMPNVPELHWRAEIFRFTSRVRTLCRRIDEDWAKMTSYVRAQLSAQNYVATTADVWSTPHRSFMGVTVHWVGVLEFSISEWFCETFVNKQ